VNRRQGCLRSLIALPPSRHSISITAHRVSSIQHQLEHLDKIYKPRGLTPQVALWHLIPDGNVLRWSAAEITAHRNDRATMRDDSCSVFKPFVYAAAWKNACRRPDVQGRAAGIHLCRQLKIPADEHTAAVFDA